MRGVGTFLVCALLGCSPISYPAGSPAPQNVCGGSTGLTCDGFPTDAGVLCLSTGTQGSCQNGAAENPVDPSTLLVVTIPPLAAVSGGSTYAIALSEVTSPPQSQTNSCVNYPSQHKTDLCYALQLTQTAAGGYVIDLDQARQAGWYLGPGPVTLPLTATFWPMWTPPGGVASDARVLNLPLPPVFANVGCQLQVELGGATTPTCQFGFDNAKPFEWAAPLPPPPSVQSLLGPTYRGVVQVAAPLDQAYPDLSFPVTIVPTPPGQMSTSTGVSVELGTALTVVDGVEVASAALISQWPATGTLLVNRADGTPFPPGWSVYIRDPATHQALTSRVDIGGQRMASVHLNYMSTQPLSIAPEKIVEPPPGDAAPTLIDSTGGAVETYPAPPPPAVVTGDVLSPYGDPVSATLLFYSNQIDDLMTCAAGESSTPLSPVVYQAVAVTEDQRSLEGRVGHFELTLPQGSYSVIVEPVGGAPFAKTIRSKVPVAAIPPVCSGASPHVAVGPLVVDLPVVVTGTFVTADGRPLAGATVDFTPAAALAPFRFDPPNAIVSGQTPCPPDDCSETWPRPFTVSTNVEGKFRIAVDHGQYDITARPEDGSGWPWVVRPNRLVQGTTSKTDAEVAKGDSAAVSPTSQALEPFTVPAPYFLGLTLLDPQQNPVANAGVEAYAFHDGVALLIGQTVTDADGHLAMALTTAFPTN